MQYLTHYQSPIGQLTLTSDGSALTGVWHANQQDFADQFNDTFEESDLLVFAKARAWLDAYFKGERPEIDFELNPQGSEFRQQVWHYLRQIPYGKTVTYSEIAKDIARLRGKQKMAAQAIGGAVGSNPISLVVPCHRVVGKNGNLTGYGGGLDVKMQLLELEGVDLGDFYLPTD